MAVVYLRKICCTFLICALVIRLTCGRKHHVELKDDARQTIELSKFGFLRKGFLSVNFSDLKLGGDPKSNRGTFGFSLEKTGSDGISPYMEQHSDRCILTKNASALTSTANQISLAFISFDLKKKCIVIKKFGKDFQNLTIDDKSYQLTTVATPIATLPQSSSLAKATTTGSATGNASKNNQAQEKLMTETNVTDVENDTLVHNSSASSLSPAHGEHPSISSLNKTLPSTRVHPEQKKHRKRRNASKIQTLPLYRVKNNVSQFRYSGRFVVQIKTKAEEGLYNLYFHNCPGRNAKEVQVGIQIDIEERNVDNYLSAGEEPLPYMFGVLSTLFFGTAIYWLHVLRKNKEFTYKVHYMMFMLVLLKSLDLMFQSVNYHFISTEGKSPQSWEVLYYITHLLKGALLFTTIVLIGTGYFFIKHVLSDRDKKIFLIVIPLQILANTAQIVMESTEEANTLYATWKELFILVDLMCCGAILFPVVWSIRHLQEGSQTDGKAALNLAKLKLFRHFYVMIVCYIYFTRIIVYLIKITVPFQYMWLDDFFNNAASYVFFVLTGYKFRPAPDNPYLHVPQEDSDGEVEMEEVITNAGFADGVTRLQSSSDGKRIFETA
ncbi:protein GPR107-like [Acropora palmata]|uniref:protein GPR107-like n=1 Tax=Acropora palmata TaxID=6131 RepID=UPI003DA183A9